MQRDVLRGSSLNGAPHVELELEHVDARTPGFFEPVHLEELREGRIDRGVELVECFDAAREAAGA